MPSDSVAISAIHLVVRYQPEIGMEHLFHTSRLKTLEEKVTLFSVFGYYLAVYILSIIATITLYRYATTHAGWSQPRIP